MTPLPPTHGPELRSLKLSGLTTLLLLIAACGDVQGSGAPGTPGLLLIDSVALQEGDSAFVGQPFDIEIASDGSFLISDLFSKRVLVFHRDGSFARTIGRSGSGPGEFVTNMVYITDLATGVVDSIPVPAVKRRGVDPEVFVQMGEAPTEELGAAAMASSLPVRMTWLPSGVIALASKDSEMDGLVYLTAATQYLSLIDPATRRSCPDALVPGPTDPPVTVGFHVDTLFVLSQAVDSVSSGEAMMRMYRIDASSCPGFGG